MRLQSGGGWLEARCTRKTTWTSGTYDEALELDKGHANMAPVQGSARMQGPIDG